MKFRDNFVNILVHKIKSRLYYTLRTSWLFGFDSRFGTFKDLLDKKNYNQLVTFIYCCQIVQLSISLKKDEFNNCQYALYSLKYLSRPVTSRRFFPSLHASRSRHQLTVLIKQLQAINIWCTQPPPPFHPHYYPAKQLFKFSKGRS